jgi:copper chaperone CopZ
MRTGKLRVSGISCAGWARELQNVLRSVNGVNEARVAAGSGEAEVLFDEKLTSLDDVKIALMQQGYSFSIPASWAVN